MNKFARLLSALAVLSLTTVGCTKKREANFPDELGEQVFAISDFGTVEVPAQPFSMSMDAEIREMSAGEKSRAAYEKGVVRIDADKVNVPPRLKFMFRGLEVQGTTGQQLPLVFAVDRDFVTAYKVVTNPQELSVLEKQLASFPAQVQAEISLQKASNQQEATKLQKEISSSRASRTKAIGENRASQYLVPLFKYRVLNFGIVERSRNELREETATLRLRKSEWTRATHIQISNNLAERLLVGMDPSQKDSLEEVFVASKINNQIMTAAQLSSDLKITTVLDEKAKVLTRVSGNNLNILEIVSLRKAQLTDEERESIRVGGTDGRIQRCTDEMKAALDAADREDCVAILRYQYAVSYVKPRLPEVTWEGTRSNSLTFEEGVRAQDSVGLIRISRNGAVQRVVSNGVLDPRSALKISELKEKEFFFRRTIEQAPGTAPVTAGFGGSLLIVKFDFTQDRLIVKRAESVVQFRRDSREGDLEQVMSFKAKYLRQKLKDDAGNTLDIPEYEETKIVAEAEYVEIDWRQNTIPAAYSPLDFYGPGCVASINDTRIRDLDQRMATGSLNFSMEYSMTMVPSRSCLSFFNGTDDYSHGITNYEVTQTVRERFSFMLNDKSTDVAFAPSVPFQVQNLLGYGLFTTARLRPSANGNTGRDGQEVSYAFTQDFRNGKKLEYILGGLPENEGRVIKVGEELIDLRELYIEMSKEVIAEWNNTLRYAFKGTNLARSGDYITYRVNGEGAPKAFLGDIDKKFIWWEETVTDDMPLLGISQPGVNPRSGIAVTDFVIMYSGHWRKFSETAHRDARLNYAFESQLEEARQQALAEINKPQTPASQPAISEPGEAVVSTGEQQALQERVNKQVSFVRDLVSGLTPTPKEMVDINKMFGRANGVAGKQGLRAMVERVRQQSQNPRLSQFDGAGIPANKAYLHKIMRKAMTLDHGASREEFQLMALTEIYDSLKDSGEITMAEKTALRSKIRSLSNYQRLAGMMKDTANCFFPARETLFANWAKASYRQVLKNAMKSTLSHEVGHSLGLTHNFIASVDKANFKFATEKENTRPASSVMDYVNDEDDHFYGGPGPYDAFALRAGYTGSLEGKEDGKYVNISQIYEALKGQWMTLTPQVVARLPVKKYLYCTDKDAGWEPTCARHDSGTTPHEIVQNILTDLERLYRLNFHDYDRLRFSYGAKYGVLSWSMYHLQQARMFLDEFIYLAAIQQDQGEFSRSHLLGALETYKYMLGLVMTPDANTHFKDPSRFALMPIAYTEDEVDAQGKPVLGADGKPKQVERKDVAVIQRKQLQDLAYTKDRFNTIGIEDLKIFATQLLTMKGTGHPRYRQVSLAISFADFEKWVLGMDASNSPLFNVLYSMLKEDLKPAFFHPKAALVQLPADFKSTTTQAMRFYSAVSGILGLETSAIDDRDNFANLFKVATNKGTPPADRPSLARIGSVAGSSQRINYFAADNAPIAAKIVAEGAAIALYSLNEEVLSKQVQTLAKAQLAVTLLGDGAAADARTTAEKAVTDAKAALVAKLKELGARKETLVFDQSIDLGAQPVEAVVDIVSQMTDNLYSGKTAQQNFKVIEQVILMISQDPTAAQKPEVQALLATLRRLKASNETVAKQIPLVALSQRALVAMAGAEAQAAPNNITAAAVAQGLELIAAQIDIGSKYGTLVNSLEFMQYLTRMTNPELFSN